MKVFTRIVGGLETNCYLLVDEEGGEAALIDPGAEAEALCRLIDGSGAKLRYILLTHGHYDHTTAVPEVRRAYPDAAVYIHADDAQGAGNHLFPLAGEISDLKNYGEGDTLPLGAQTIEVLSTPGHSRGSVTLRCGNLLFTGDTLFAGSCGRVDLPGGSWDEMLSSLARLAALPGEYSVYPGHMNASTLEYERLHNLYLRSAMKGGDVFS